MALKAVLENKEEIPAGTDAFYEEQDGKYILKVEGMSEKSKLDEFRNSNIELRNKLDEVAQLWTSSKILIRLRLVMQ